MDFYGSNKISLFNTKNTRINKRLNTMRKNNIFNKKTISISRMIIISFVAILLSISSIISYLAFRNCISSTNEMIKIIKEDITHDITDHIDRLVNIPLNINKANHQFIERRIIDVKDDAIRDFFFAGVIKNHIESSVYSFSYGTEDGEYYGARKNDYNNIEIMKNNKETYGNTQYYSLTGKMNAGEFALETGKFDPRTRAWYKTAKEADKPVFSEVYKHFLMDDLAISAAYPIHNEDGTLRGVLATHITLSNMDSFLKESVEDKNAIGFIVEKDTGDIVASSLGLKNFRTLSDGSIERFNIEGVNNKSIAKAYAQYTKELKDKFRIKDKGDWLHINITEYENHGANWLIITGISEAPFTARTLHNFKLTILLITMALVISIVIYMKLTNLFLKPIHNLIKTAEIISKGDLSYRAQIIRDDEIGKLSKAFNEMANRLYILVNTLEERVKSRTRELVEINGILQDNKDNLQLILNSTYEGIYGIDKNGICTFLNESCLRILGYTNEDELIGKNMHKLIHHSNKDGILIPEDECILYQAFLHGKGIQMENEVFWREDGTFFDVSCSSYPQFKNGEIIGAVVSFMDVTERKKTEDKIKYLSYHDSLTGLYNRTFFEEELKRLDTTRNLPISIVVGDVNGLKLTNDIFGHATGDILLKRIAEVLTKVCRKDDIIARVGGDEFIILLPKTGSIDSGNIVYRIKKEFSKEQIMAIRGSISMGISTKMSEELSMDDLLESAEEKMYLEKTINRKNICNDQISTIMHTLQEYSPREEHHYKTVSKISESIGRAMNLIDVDLKRLKDAAYLHDIGKIVLKEESIKEYCDLNEQDRKKMNQHPVIGYRILNSFDSTIDLADIVLTHHEKWDGTGYPKGLKGEEIPTLSRIISVAEAYDSITNIMSKNRRTNEEAIEIIRRKSGIDYDPDIVDIFIRLIEERPQSIFN